MLPADLVVEEVYSRQYGGSRGDLQQMEPNTDIIVPAVTSTSRSTPCSRTATPVTPKGKPQENMTSFLSKSGTAIVSVLRILSKRTPAVRPTPITTPFTVIGLQYLFVQDTVWLPACTAMAMVAMKANMATMRAIFALEAIEKRRQLRWEVWELCTIDCNGWWTPKPRHLIYAHSRWIPPHNCPPPQ